LYLPIVVSHVDSRFRTIAESTALLWARIDVNLPLSLASLYLKRSKNALLDIQIDVRDGGLLKNAASRRLHAFLALAADHRERIISLSMSAFQPEQVDEMVEVMMVGPKSTYPQLRRLDTGCPIWVRIIPPLLFLEPLEYPVVVPPQLQELSLRGRRSQNWVTAFPGPLAGLKSLCLANNTKLFLSDLLIVLAKLPNLETLWAFDFRNWLDRERLLVALLHANPQLESLDLCNGVFEQPVWREAFSKVKYLKYLRLLSCELENNNLKALLELAVEEGGEQDSLPHLEHLVLDNVFHLTTRDIRRIITHSPGIRFLELRGWDGSNVADDDVQFICESVECFILQTFYKESGALDEQGEDEDHEEWSSSGTSSEGSWLSGDEEICIRPAV
ncbi:hypothetical protein M407DRAFT_212540, partial [Tulasnella calospora MUT 4182]